MPGGSLFALLDDIATILDDVSVLAKVATKKTAGVLGDDLALNAQQVAGVDAKRELPVVWAVAKGSALNKLILVPLALLISAIAPWLVTPLLMFGGAFLCYEGAHKLVESWSKSRTQAQAEHRELIAAVANPEIDLVALERDKIKAAIRTDFVLSAEIVAITLGTVAASPLVTRVGVLVVIAALMTVGVYGLVAGIVKLDDAGLHLASKPGRGAQRLGAFILAFAPRLMRFLSIAGTAAMFMVGGGILVHGLAPVASLLHAVETQLSAMPSVGGALAWLTAPIGNGLFGLLAGLAIVALLAAGGQLLRRQRG
ncbi:MAG: DUF808 domain-containing protein [Myxococcales bacterium]|nr:DUF808 domain-containing protein [Myxococcales bacterium]